MVPYAHILLTIVCMICYALSQSLDGCTNLTTMCPISARWLKRGKFYKCPGKRSYVCLMSDDKTLREGCIFNIPIQAGTIGCPHTKQCDSLTKQPVLVDSINYLPCPPDHDGCPPRNHSGYSILDIHKYPMCQGRSISTKRTTSPDRVIDVPIPILPNKSTRDESNGTIIIFTILGIFIFISLCVVVIVIKKCRGLPGVHCGSLEANNQSYNRLLEHNSGVETLEYL